MFTERLFVNDFVNLHPISLTEESIFRGNGAGRPAGCKPVGPVSEAGRRFDSPCPFQRKADGRLKVEGERMKKRDWRF